MPGLIITGSRTLGPAPTAAISTLPAYLASIGKNSWYARFVAGTNMWSGTALNGSAVTTTGNNVVSWGPDASNTSNWTAYWTQSAGSGAAPFYAASNGINSIVGTGNDVSDTRSMDLSSTTALNGTYTVIMRHPLLARDSKAPYSHNTSSVYWTTSTGGSSLLSAVVASGTTAADQIIWVLRNSPGTSSGNTLFGISTTTTGHNNSAPRLLRRSSAYSITSVSEIWFTPQLTAAELDTAMTFVS